MLPDLLLGLRDEQLVPACSLRVGARALLGVAATEWVLAVLCSFIAVVRLRVAVRFVVGLLAGLMAAALVRGV